MTDDDIREIAEALDAEEHPESGDEQAEEPGSGDVLPEHEHFIDEPAGDANDHGAADMPAEEPIDTAGDSDGDDDGQNSEPLADPESNQETTVLPAVGGPWAPASSEDATPFSDEPLPGESEMLPLDPVAAAEADAAAAAAADDVATTGAAATPEAAPLMDFGPESRDRTWIWWTLTAIALLATIAVGAWWYLSLRTVPVPNLVGLKTADAVFAIADLGLTLGDAAEVSTDTVPPGQVVSQKPEKGTQLHPGDSVSVLISKAPVMSKVPEVKQKTREDAEETLAKASLRPYVVQSYSPTAAVDYVMSQLPANGTELSPGSTVVLAVSKGPAPASIRVPSLLGMSSADAIQLLTSLDLIGQEYRSIDPSKTVGTVITQVPPAGSSVKYNDRVLFAICERSSTTAVTVPNVVGAKRKAAEKTLTDKNLKTQITFVADPRVPKDEVIRQMPASGAKATRSAVVGLLVSRGTTETLSVPDVTGKSTAEAEAAIKKGGFTAAMVPVKLPGSTPGMSVVQFPAAGSQWYYRFPVIVLVGKL